MGHHPIMGRVTVIAAAFLAALASAGGHAQTSATPSTGLLMGVIVDSVTEQPAANAQVVLGGAVSGVGNINVLTDAEGRFVFLDLPSGTYTLTVTKAGYADGAYGRRRPGGRTQTLALATAERIGDIKIPIWKHAVITGTIRDEFGEPMVNVPVRVLIPTVIAGRPRMAPGPVARTDDRGVYRIRSLTPGDYAVVVPSTQTTAPQSVIDQWARGRGSSPGDLGRDLSFSGASDALNLLGRPDASIPKVGSLAFASASGNMRTAVSLRSVNGRLFVYPTQYFPGAMSAAQATLINVRSGEERAGVDVQLRTVATSRVAGTVTGPSGPLIAAMTLVPDPSELSTDAGLETARTLSDAEGRFTFLGVPPGRYQLRAIRAEIPPNPGVSRGAPPPTPRPATKGPPPPTLPGYTLSATQSIAVDSSDIGDLVVAVRPGFRISGRAEFSGATPPDPELVRRMSAAFDPADARPLVTTIIGRGQFQDDGQLWSYQLTPGRYYLRINNPPIGWTLKSAMWNGRDISNVPLELDRDVDGVVITFTNRPSAVSGQVQNVAGAPDASATVLIFPAESGSWVDYGDLPPRLRAVRVDKDGRYVATGFPAGNYLVAAIAEEASAHWQDPKTLQALARVATAITLADGESRQVGLKTLTVPAR
jgi:hypothetical protein